MGTRSSAAGSSRTSPAPPLLRLIKADEETAQCGRRAEVAISLNRILPAVGSKNDRREQIRRDLALPLVPAYPATKPFFSAAKPSRNKPGLASPHWTKGDSVMSAFFNALSRNARTLVIVNSLAGAAVLLAMAAPQPVSSGALGSEWHCSTTALVLTTCRQTR